MSEIWREIRGFEGLYAVSSYGNVKALPKCNPRNGLCWPERPMTLHHCPQGYLVVWLRKPGGVHQKFRVHRLVADAFLPHDPERPFVNHKDKDRSHNHIDNLEYMTHKENMDHRDNHDPNAQTDDDIINPEDIPF